MKNNLLNLKYNKFLVVTLIGFMLIFMIGSVSAIDWNSEQVISCYDFDEGAGTSIGNYLGSGGTDLAIIGASYSWVSGIFNSAVTIESNPSTYINFTDLTDYQFGNSNFSMSFWIYINDSTGGDNDPRVINFEFGDIVGGDSIFYIQNSVNLAWGNANYNAYTGKTNAWHHVGIQKNGTNCSVFLDGVVGGYGACENSGNFGSLDTANLGYESPSDNYDISFDSVIVFDKVINATAWLEIYNSGTGMECSNYNIIDSGFSNELISPTNNSVVSTSEQEFITHLNMSGTTQTNLNWTNNTFYVWDSDGEIFNQTTQTGLTSNNTRSNITINNFLVGNYYFNSYACYANTTYSNCTWSSNGNFTLTLASSINSISYSNSTFETSIEQFIVNLSLFEGAEVSLAQLVYNGTSYTISDVTSSGNNYIFRRNINIPLNVNGSANQTNEFYIKFTYGGSYVQTFGPYEQNSSFIKLIQCGTPYTLQSLNFTFVDEDSQLNINGSLNKTTIRTSFKYWIGDGGVYKTYSFQNLTSSLNNYQFCIYPYQADNFTFKADMDMDFSAVGYRENSYLLRNSTLTNISNNVLLYLLSEDAATKFFLTFKKGTNLISGATVTVQKYFAGFGEYKTVAILGTDDDGKATMWQEVDSKFRYSIVKDGVLLGVVERVSICSAAPCTLTIQITEDIASAFEAYYDYYAINILSNLSYDRDSKIVTYEFIDITGLANYFRLEVKNSRVNGTGTVICNSIAYTSAGTVICNITGYDGDFTATGYVSRSPEKVDKVYHFLVDDEIIDALGLTGLLIVAIILITLVIAAAVISRGNPSTVLFVLGVAILGLKLATLFPFSWVVVTVLEVLIFFMIFKIKT